MPRLRSAVAVVLACALAAPAAAQPGAAPASQTEKQRYDRAFEALVAGRLDAAIAGFGEVAERAADPELRAEARELLRLARRLRESGVVFEVKRPGAKAPQQPERAVPAEDLPGAGRVEFIFSTTLASIYTGALLIPITDVSDVRAGAAILTGTTAVGFVGSFYGSRGRDISEGMASSYFYGLVLGSANGLLLASPLGVDSTRGVLALGLAGEAVGGVGAFALANYARPTTAAADFTFLLSVMGIGTTGLGLAILQPDFQTDTTLTVLAGGMDLGAAIGIARAPGLTWSSSRTRLVGLSAILGAVAGVGGGLLVVGAPEKNEVRALAGSTLAGAWAGLGLGVYLTRHMEPHARYRGAGASSDRAVLLTPALLEGGPGVVAAGSF